MDEVKDLTEAKTLLQRKWKVYLKDLFLSGLRIDIQVFYLKLKMPRGPSISSVFPTHQVADYLLTEVQFLNWNKQLKG